MLFLIFVSIPKVYSKYYDFFFFGDLDSLIYELGDFCGLDNLYSGELDEDF